jgi:hypothetical protein
MDTDRSDRTGYIISALLGGGLVVAVVTNAFPK